MSCTIAVAQTTPAPGDVAANVAQHLALAELAAQRQAQVLVFPELSLTGYEIALAEGLALTLDDARLTPLIERARAWELTLIVGAPVRVDARLHLGALILPPAGAVRLYTKHHLGAFPPSAACDGTVPPAEATVFDPGSSNPLLDVGGRVAALAVCADTGVAAHAARAAERGARLYLAGMFVIPSFHDAETANLETIAMRHAMTVAFANFGAPSGGLAASGGSAIWSGRGACVARLASSGAGAAVATEHAGEWRGETRML